MPPLKTRFWEVPGLLDYACAEFWKKVRFPPSADGPPGGGGFPHFFPKKVASIVEQTGNFPKKWSKTEVLCFWTILGILGILGQNGEVPGPLLDSKVLKKTVHHPYGATSGCIWAAETQGTQNTPSGERLRSAHRGGVQFSSIPCVQ